MTTYDFALLRYVQDPVAGERLNIGVVLYDRDNRRLFKRFSERYGRISKAFGDFDGVSYRNLVRHLEQRISALEEDIRQPNLLEESPATLDEIFKRVFPDDLSCFEPSPVMWGYYDDPERSTAELFDEYVARYEEVNDRHRRDEGDVWHDVEKKIRQRGLLKKMTYGHLVHGADYSYLFRASWNNDGLQVLEPISFDLKEGNRIVEKAINWNGRLHSLAKGADFAFTGVIAPPTDKKLEQNFDQAVRILHSAPNVKSLVKESDSDAVIRDIERNVTPA